MNPPYVLAGRDDRERREERERIALVERYHDPLTAAALAAVGVVPGWRAWEVGAGGGSIARRLSALVGAAGSVLATDLDPGPVAALGLANVRALRHDLLADPPPAEALDLVHARLVLLHLPTRREAVARMSSALRPGGALVLGDVDFTGHAPLTADASWTRVWDGFREATAAAGWDLEIGRRLPEMLEQAGLERVESLRMGGDVAGGSLRCRLQRATLERLRPVILATGRCDAADLDAAGTMLLDPARAFRAPEIWAAWGRRPVSAGAGRA